LKKREKEKDVCTVKNENSKNEPIKNSNMGVY